MVQPDRVTEESKRPERPRSMLIAATVGVFVIAAFTLGRFTAPEVEATASTGTTPPLSQPTTTMDPTTFRVVDIQQGTPVRWARGFGVEDMWPVALLEFDGRFYVFGNSSPPGVGLSAEARILTSDDGVFWVERPHDLTDTGFSVHEAISTGDSLLAFGVDEAGGEAVVWESSDGLSWTRELLPLPRILERGEAAFIRTAANRDGSTYVFGGIADDARRLVVGYLPGEIAAQAVEGPASIEWTDSSVTVRAPFGLTAFTGRFDELGMPDEVIDRLRENGLPREPLVWRSAQPSRWDVSAFDASWVDQAAIDEDGTITVTGFGQTSQSMWVSSDGVTWQESRLDDRMGPFAWQDGLLAAVDNGLGSADVSVSTDGSTWNSTGVAELLPDFLDWFIRPLSTGDAGVALFATGDPRTGIDSPPPDDAVLERDGYRLTYRFDEDVLTMDHLESGETIFTTDSLNPAVSAPATVDLTAGTVTFHDPNTQRDLITLSLLEMEAVELQALRSAHSVADLVKAFVWSRDAATWAVQDTTNIMVDLSVQDLLITDDRMIAITMDAFFGGSRPPRVVPWLGLIPSS